jgi:DNA-binding response OmpR family regulator
MGELNNGKILLLDDDSFITKIYESKFAEASCSVRSAGSVDDAMRILRAGYVPDVIIFDVEMKGKDGFEFLKELREYKLAIGAHLIALTNHSGEADRKKAMELGTKEYIVKAEMIPEEVVRAVLATIAKK